ncbi:MAG: hypothetical protein M4579_006243 [Chaenotheca gracillima]|nr:MAG: hypothetical protein M4579_006243 [Chaenotheca gracillima]
MVHSEAKCLCGASRISWDAEPLLKVLPLNSPSSSTHPQKHKLTHHQFRCHCRDERHLSGNGFSNNYLLDTTTLRTISGDALKTWSTIVESGNNMTSHFCSTCGSLIYRTSTGYPGTFALKVGNVDDDGEANRVYVPQVEIFTRTRVPWVKAVEGAKQEIADFT